MPFSHLRLIRRRGVPSALCAGALLFWTLGCIDQISELTPQDACDAVGFSIANRTLKCTGDADLATARWETAAAGTCLVEWTGFEGVDESFRCSEELGALSCARVAAFGDDISRWLGSVDACAGVVSVGGTVLGTGDTGSAR